jgi:hypothetical protein
MISADSFLEKLRKLFEERGFLSYENSSKDKSSENASVLHEGVRQVLGLKTEDSVYMYWEWRQLKSSFDAMWTEFDRSASKIDGRTTSIIAFCSRPEISLADLLQVLDLVDQRNLLAFPQAVRRPTKSESQVRFVGKRLGAILMTLAIAADLTNSGYGDLLSTMSEAGKDEIATLDFLDRLIVREQFDKASIKGPSQIVISRALGRAYEKTNIDRARDEISEFNFSEFLRETESNSNWAGLSDKDVLRRLLTIAPDTAEASKKANEKFLSN